MTQAPLPQEELAFIRRIMADSRGQVADDGKPSIAWGLVVFLGMMYTYFEAINGGGNTSGWIWMGLSLCGCIYMFLWVRNKHRRERARSFAERVTSAIWGAVGFSIAIFILATNIGFAFDRPVELPSIFILAVVSIFIAIGFYVSGILYEIPWLRWVAIGWWIVGVTTIFWPGLHSLLIYSAAELLLQVLPGIILLRKYRQTQTA